MGTAILKFQLPLTTKVYDLVVSTYQMCILYLFNYYEELTLAQIAEHMGFDEETAKKNMQSLMVMKSKLLTHVDGKFKINALFTSP